MSAIADVLARMGHTVSGSDLKPSANLERLRGLGVRVHVGHDPSLVANVDAVAISTAVPARDPEVRAAREAGTTILSRAEVLTAIVATRRAIAVAGTHGKTTTSSMLALILVEAGIRPSFIVGGELNEIGTGAAWDAGEWLVVEADESDGTFLQLGAEAAIVTSVEPDHLEHYGGVEGMVDAFDGFLAQTPGVKITSADDTLANRLGRANGALTYGTAADADYRMLDLESRREGTSFSLARGADVIGRLRLPVPGEHNARNAAAAAVAALEIGVPFDAVARALGHYGGVARRFQFRGEGRGVTFVDDYAHLPTEVRAALATAKDGGWRRVVCVFQPHRYSRTQALAPDFANAFVDADLLIVTDVYPAGEAPRPGVSGKLIVNAVLDAQPMMRVAYFPRREPLIAYLRNRLRPGDLCLALSAGDLTSVTYELLHDAPAAKAG
ncbi:MAG: UDP-N-acetylmuramate--L-alanine ligase [Actinobacteria bacterium]|nr:MAG: UDP-N-acetylmuramate--L-alanine ligase [Actinomycetota bacterium]